MVGLSVDIYEKSVILRLGATINKGAGMLFTYSENAGAAYSFLGFEGKEAGYMTVFCMCAVAYLFAWVVMKILVPAYKKIS